MKPPDDLPMAPEEAEELARIAARMETALEHLREIPLDDLEPPLALRAD